MDQDVPRGRAAALARGTVPWGFPIVYLGWAYLFWAPVVVSEASVWSFPNVLLFVLGGASPLVAGLLMMWVTRGRDGLVDLGHRLVDVGRIAPRWWLVILCFWPAFTLLVAGVAIVVGLTSTPLEFASTGRLFDPVGLLSILVFAFLLPLPEEIGLRGYWLDELQDRWSALTAALINGTGWALWHVPIVYVTGYFAGTTFDPSLSWWMPMLVLVSIPHVWIYNNTNRSLLAVLVFHAFVNLTGEVMGFGPELYPFVLVGYVVVAALLVVGWGPTSLRGWQRAPPRPTTQPASDPP